jgi:hypothetical protein
LRVLRSWKHLENHIDAETTTEAVDFWREDSTQIRH